MSSFRLTFVCLLFLFLAASVQAQSEPEKAPSLNDAKTTMDVLAYINSEAAKLNLPALKPEDRAVTIAGLLMPASDKILEIATSTNEKRQAYMMKLSAFNGLVQANIEGAEQKFEAFLNELSAQEEFAELAELFRFRNLVTQMMDKKTEDAEQKLEAFLKVMETKDKSEDRLAMVQTGQFLLFGERAKKTAVSPENFAKFTTELKGWTFGKQIPINEVASLGFAVALRNKAPAEQVVKELSGYIQASPTLSAEEKKELIEVLELALRLAPGADPKLYGKTLDDKDFDWKSLRGKYVLIKFTATWCGPCKMQIPGMLEAYAKYKDKGLEIVSVYVFERSGDPVTSVREAVEEEKLPWIILSEALTEKANQPPYGKNYGIEGVPTIVLVDKEGKIMIPATHGDEWKKKLAEIFE